MLGQFSVVIPIYNQPGSAIGQGAKLLGRGSPANVQGGWGKAADEIMESSPGASAGTNVGRIWEGFEGVENNPLVLGLGPKGQGSKGF